MNYKRRRPKRNRGKYLFEDYWSFKKNFKRDYIDKKEFKKRMEIEHWEQ